VWCGQWNFQGTGFTFSGQSNLESSPDKCLAFDYRSSDSGTDIDWWCIYCPLAGGSVPSDGGTKGYFSLNNFMTYPAVNILNATYGLIADEDNNLAQLSECGTMTAAFVAQTATAGSVSSVYSQPGQKIVFTGSLPNTLREVNSIIYDGRLQASPSTQGSDPNFPQGSFASNSECWLSTSSETNYNNFLPITCPSSSASSILTFTGIHAVVSTQLSGVLDT